MRTFVALAALAFMALNNAASAASSVTTPCHGTTLSPFPDPGSPPVIRMFTQSELRGWRPAECTGFSPLDVNSVVVTVGRFRLHGGVDVVAGRLARVSALSSIKYYPDDEDGWRRLFNASYALGDGAIDALLRRPDFQADDIQPGRTLRYWLEENSLLRPAAYRLTVRERSPDRLVYSIVNESDIRALFVRAIDAGEMRQLYVIERDPDYEDVWRFSGIVDARSQAGPFSLPARSYISRAAAYYRYMAGIPTDLEPPVAP
jgi:hypothetical protein